MLTFSPTEEQEEIRQLARSVAFEQFRQEARRSEKNGDISSALAQVLGQTGLTTPFSEDYGGQGDIDAVTYALIAEELSFGDGSLAMNVLGSLIAPVTIALAGSESQKEHGYRPSRMERPDMHFVVALPSRNVQVVIPSLISAQPLVKTAIPTSSMAPNAT